MAEQRLMMFKLVTGEQIIAMVERRSGVGGWTLSKPRLVTSLWAAGRDVTLVGAPWIHGLEEEAANTVPLDSHHAILIYYAKHIDITTQEQYASATNRP